MQNKLYKNFKNPIPILLVLLLLTTPIIQANTFNVSKSNFGDDETLQSNMYDLVIIAPTDFLDSLEPLVEHKIEMGVKTRLVSLPEAYRIGFWGRDCAEEIKYFIKQAYDEWGIKYVMLVGNFRKMPVRYVYNDESWEGYPEPYYLSDLYYADIYDSNDNYSSWDTNNNGVFGEWKGETAQDYGIDLKPDVYVGRLACRNVLEVKTMVNKIITYETTTYGSDWFGRVVAIAGDTYPDGQYDFPTPGYEGEENARFVFENMSDFEPVELFTSNGNFTGTLDVLKAFKEGCGFVSFDGHANPFRWSTHPPNDHDTWVNGLSVLTISLLRNKNKYPIVIAGACHNSQFDTHLSNILTESFYHYTWTPECWGWKMTRKIGGGAIATIANTGLGMSKEDKTTGEGAGDYMDLQFFYEYGTNGTEILGECWGKAINRYLNAFPIDWNTPSSWDFAYDCKTVQQWVLLGDPSLKIGGYPPQL